MLDAIHGVSHDVLNRPIPDEARGSILGILDHIAVAENWYLDQPGCGLAQAHLPADPLEKLERVRANTRKQLVRLIGDERITEDNELWSARKVLRRTLWHERDHTQHIVKLLGNLDCDMLPKR